MRECVVTILSNKEIADNTYEMVLGADGEHGITRPGQFINIKLAGFFLRRPISVCDWDEQTIKVIYKVVGKGTEMMSHMMQGDTLNILTALGNGFNIEAGASDAPMLIGGGAGIPPLYGLARRLVEAGKSPVAILGFNYESEAFYIDEFKKLGIEVRVTTVDGSIGIKGFVTDVIEDVEYFYACGPEAMLRAIDRCSGEHVNGQMSFEERMGCGFGACMGCSCKTKYGSKRICKDGPVLERSEVIW